MTAHYYIHIPFCRQRCPYCKFALTPVFDDFKKRRYIEYLKKEIREYFLLSSRDTRDLLQGADSSYRQNDKEAKKTIYFGGWTPSVLSHDEILEVLECFPFYRESAIEITMEMNPEDVTPEYISGVLELGINRISLWVQTLNETSLSEIHRSDRDTIFHAIESISSILSSRGRPFAKHWKYPWGARDLPQWADSSYCQNDKREEKEISLNIDFILGLPFVKPGETLAGIQELHERFPYITHTSVYMLEDEEYPKHWRANSITEDEMQSEFLEIMDYFESIGWHHYELSNFSKKWYESLHNQAYWEHSDTRGFGLSAASFEWWKRWSNSSSFNGYYEWKRDNEEKLTQDQIQIEQMMFGLRRDGIKIQNSKLQIQSKKTRELEEAGLIEIMENTIKPTKTWIFVIDHILSELISD